MLEDKDEEELGSAVQFLHEQSERLIFELNIKLYRLSSIFTDEVLHFEGSSLEGFYFLDVPWIFSLMVNIMKMPNNNGKACVNLLSYR